MFHGGRPLSLRGSLKALEADIHHANTLYVILSSLFNLLCISYSLDSWRSPLLLDFPGKDVE
jgi:hypothetical protein